MKHPSWLSASLLMGAALLTTALSAFGFTQEVTHFSAAGTTEVERIDSFIAGDRRPGLSEITQTSFMLDCRNAMVSQISLTAPLDQRQALYHACLNAALSIASTSPNASLAWISAAHAASALGDVKTMNATLARSYQTGRNEAWIAKLRAELVELNYASIDPDLLPKHDHDLALLLNVSRPDFIANLYVQNPGAREHITKVADTLPDNVKRVFLYMLDQTIKNRSAS